MAIAGWRYNNFLKRFGKKVKPSNKRYNRKKERSINNNPIKEMKDEN